MTKTGMILWSLVSALAGGGMAAVMIMAFLNYKGGWGIGTQAVAGLLFAVGALLAAMPVGIALFAGPKAPKAAAKSKGEAKAEDVSEAEVEADEPVDDDEVAEAEEAEEPVEEAEFEEAGTDGFDDSEGTVDFAPEESTGDHEFDLGDEFEEDSGTGKKKK